MDPKRAETGQRSDFTRAVLQDLRALRRLIDEDRIERDVRRVGAEQEVVLVDRHRRVAPIAMDLLAELDTTVDRQIVEGEWVATVFTARGTHLGEWLGMKPTGSRLLFTGVNVDRVLIPFLESGAVKVSEQ